MGASPQPVPGAIARCGNCVCGHWSELTARKRPGGLRSAAGPQGPGEVGGLFFFFFFSFFSLFLFISCAKHLLLFLSQRAKECKPDLIFLLVHKR